MGIYNRDYYRDDNFAPALRDWGLTPWMPGIKWIILVNVAVFLMQIFVVRREPTNPLERLPRSYQKFEELLAQAEDNPELLQKLKDDPEFIRLLQRDASDGSLTPGVRQSILEPWLQLDPDRVLHGEVWRLVTHGFCHDRFSLWHIVVNMLLLYWFGTTLEIMLGTREFLCFYLTAIVVGGLAYVGLEMYLGTSHSAVGASGAILAVMTLYTMHFPYRIIYVFWFIPLEMRWCLLLYVLYDLHPVLLALSGDSYFTGVGHAAHLGGAAFGFLYYRYDWHLTGLLGRSRMGERRASPRLRIAPETVPVQAESGASSDEVDHLLRKIFASGQASLTDEERGILQKASERLKSKRNDDA